MKVHHDDAPSPPPCWNADPIAPVRVRHGLDSETGAPTSVPIRNDWASPGCKTWAGVGIGPPTAEYPSGTPYPIAHGWAAWCRQCRHAPASIEPTNLGESA